MEEREYTCDCCGETVHEDDVRYSEWTETTMCESCEQGDMEYASKLYRFSPDDGVQVVMFGDHTAYYGDGDFVNDTGLPKWADDFWPKNWTGRKYHQSSGWSGYYCTGDLFDLHKLEDGWATGGWSDVPHKWSFNEFVEGLVSQEIVPPAPLYILFEPTSNVFSTATTVMCHEHDVDTLTRWIAEELNFDLHTSLS